LPKAIAEILSEKGPPKGKEEKLLPLNFTTPEAVPK
jgi:hypothetical protein